MIIGGTILERCFFRRNASVIFDLKFLARPVNVIRFRDSSEKHFSARRCAVLDPNAWLLSLFPGTPRRHSQRYIYIHTHLGLLYEEKKRRITQAAAYIRRELIV